MDKVQEVNRVRMGMVFIGSLIIISTGLFFTKLSPRIVMNKPKPFVNYYSFASTKSNKLSQTYIDFVSSDWLFIPRPSTRINRLFEQQPTNIFDLSVESNIQMNFDALQSQVFPIENPNQTHQNLSDLLFSNIQARKLVAEPSEEEIESNE